MSGFGGGVITSAWQNGKLPSLRLLTTGANTLQMCGRFDFHGTFLDIEAAFKPLDHLLGLPPPCYNIAPTMPAAALTRQDKALTVATLTFGWKRRKGGLWVNVRSETYQPRHSAQPCAIVANGFFEWQQRDGRKQPFYCQLADRRLFALAALQRGGQFVVLTRPSSGNLKNFHDRMPVALDAPGLELWLHGAGPETLGLSAEAFIAHPVSPRVNDARHDGPDCIVPLVPTGAREVC